MKFLPLKSIFQESQQEFGFIPTPLFLPFIYLFNYFCVAGTVCFPLPSQNFGIFHISSTSCFTHASGFSKALWFYMPSLLKAWFYIPSSGVENLTLSSSNSTNVWRLILFYFNKHDSAIVPDQTVNFQQTQITRFLCMCHCGTGLLFTCCVYPFFCK